MAIYRSSQSAERSGHCAGFGRRPRYHLSVVGSEGHGEVEQELLNSRMWKSTMVHLRPITPLPICGRCFTHPTQPGPAADGGKHCAPDDSSNTWRQGDHLRSASDTAGAAHGEKLGCHQTIRGSEELAQLAAIPICGHGWRMRKRCRDLLPGMRVRRRLSDLPRPGWLQLPTTRVGNGRTRTVQIERTHCHHFHLGPPQSPSQYASIRDGTGFRCWSSE